MIDINILQTDPEHPFAQYVRILGKGKKGSRSFSENEAYDAMNMILKDEVEPVQLGAFLMLLRVKEESPEELSGFVKAVKEHILARNALRHIRVGAEIRTVRDSITINITVTGPLAVTMILVR